jgi:hypothetical protein
MYSVRFIVRLSLATAVLRTVILVVGLGLMASGVGYCPAGQSDCDMTAMDDMAMDESACVLACGVLLEQSVAAVATYVGKASALPAPVARRLAGASMEPVVPPPRDGV